MVLSSVPIGIHNVMLGNTLIELSGLVRVNFFNELGWYTTPQFTVAHLRTFQHQCPSGDDGTFANDGIIEHRRSHADKGATLHRAAVKRDVVADGHVVANLDGGLLVERVQTGAILNIHSVTYFYIVDVSTYHGIEPHCALVAHRDVAHDGCVLRKIAVLPPFGRQTAHCFNECHIVMIVLDL